MFLGSQISKFRKPSQVKRTNKKKKLRLRKSHLIIVLESVYPSLHRRIKRVTENKKLPVWNDGLKYAMTTNAPMDLISAKFQKSATI